MKSIRIGTGAGGCTFERLEPCADLVERGNLDYLVFECLSERTLASAQKEKLQNKELGYNPMLEVRMRRFLKPCVEQGIKIVSNMGAANTLYAVRKIAEIATELGISHLKIGYVLGDDITDSIHDFDAEPLYDSDGLLGDLSNVISANVYFGSDGIVEALNAGAQVVVTGRVVDVALFTGPIFHEFPEFTKSADKRGQAILLGHLMECNAQVSGGYFYDPYKKEIENLENIGFPIAEMSESGDFVISKLPETGGLVSVDTCKEQLLYEINDPSNYIGPDGIADFGNVHFEAVGSDAVAAMGATSRPAPATYKVNVGYLDGFKGIGEVSYAGPGCLERAQAIAQAVQKRWDIAGLTLDRTKVSIIGYNSVFGDKIAEQFAPKDLLEVRVRFAVHAYNRLQVELANRETMCLSINGAAGSAGTETRVEEVLAIDNIIIPRNCVEYSIGIWEV